MLHAVPCHAQFAWLRVSLLAGTGPSKKQVPVHVTPPLRWPLCLFVSLFFVFLVFLLRCPSFVLSPSSCLTLGRFLPLYASSLLDNHNPCLPSSRYSLLRQQLWMGKTRHQHSPWESITRTEPLAIDSRPLRLFEISAVVD